MKLITGKLDTPCHANSGLVDLLTQSPMHICVARSLSPLANGSDILLQVMNISPTPVTIYKGTKLATMLPEHGIMLVSHSTSVVTNPTTATPSALDQIDLSHLKTEEHSELTQLLVNFSHVFAENSMPTRQTSVVKHSIPTTGPPI